MSFTHAVAHGRILLGYRRRIVVTGLLVAGAALGCEPRRSEADDVERVVISPESVKVQLNEAANFTAVAFTASGDTSTAGVVWAATTGIVSDTGTSGRRHYGRYQNAACGDGKLIARSSRGTKADTAGIRVICPPPGGGTTAVLVGAGDIADCDAAGDEATTRLLDSIAGSVFTVGDNAYGSGAASEYAKCYEPSWGRHKARTRPAPGNHDYRTRGARAYYDYFGALAGPAGQGYYSYDLGDWHVISLNSNISMRVGSAQEQWLRADLAASPKRCTLAYWHHPRFTSGTEHGNSPATQPLWQALYEFGAEIVIAGHEHNYERFAPQTPDGQPDSVRGIREFVVGTGGGDHYNDMGTPLATSEIFNGTTWGVLKLTLAADHYTWEFVPVAGETFRDSGRGTCH